MRPNRTNITNPPVVANNNAGSRGPAGGRVATAPANANIANNVIISPITIIVTLVLPIPSLLGL